MQNGFKKVILRGNAIDMAAGFVIGATFPTVVSAVTNGLIAPLIAALAGKPHFLATRFAIGKSVFSLEDLITALVALLLVAAGMYFLVAAPFNTLIARLRREPALPVERFGVVWENRLTRSGTPEDASGWNWLRSQGVKSVVTFRKKKVAYSEYGFKHVLQIPISENSPVASITDEQADEFLRFVRDPSHAPVHIHCKKGRNRTGMMTALVRYAIDGWTMEKALEEAKRYHYNTDLPEDRIAWLRSWASRNEPGSYRLEPNGKRV